LDDIQLSRITQKNGRDLIEVSRWSLALSMSCEEVYGGRNLRQTSVTDPLSMDADLTLVTGGGERYAVALFMIGARNRQAESFEGVSGSYVRVYHF
jgi:hypothetical protein